MNLRQAAQQALESMDDHMYRADTHEFYEAKEALRAALAEPERKPFGDDAERYARKLHEEREYYKGLFTAPTPRKPLTDELERKSDAIQRLWKERDELRALNAELVEALRDIARQQEGDEESAQAVARAALAKVASNGS